MPFLRLRTERNTPNTMIAIEQTAKALAITVQATRQDLTAGCVVPLPDETIFGKPLSAFF